MLKFGALAPDQSECLLKSVGEELKLGFTVLQIQLVIRAGIEPGIPDSKPGILTTRPRCLPEERSATNATAGRQLTLPSAKLTIVSTNMCIWLLNIFRRPLTVSVSEPRELTQRNQLFSTVLMQDI